MVPNDKITLNADQTVTFQKMLDAFEDNDDVQDIYHNVDLPEDEEEEKTDEFEKFVSGFSKGEVPKVPASETSEKQDNKEDKN